MSAVFPWRLRPGENQGNRKPETGNRIKEQIYLIYLTVFCFSLFPVFCFLFPVSLVYADQWKETFDAEDFKLWKVIGGKWTVEAGALVGKPSGADEFPRVIAQTPWDLAEGKFEIKFQFDKRGASDAIFLLYRMVDDNNGYIMLIGAAGSFNFGRFEAGIPRILFSPPLKIDPNKPNTIKLDIGERTALVFLNDTLAFRVGDDAPADKIFKKGKVGFGIRKTNSAPVAFDEITVEGDGVFQIGGQAVKAAGKLAVSWGAIKRLMRR